MAEYTNGTGKCPTGAANSTVIIDLRRRVEDLEDTVKETSHATQSAFAQFSAKLDAVLEKCEDRRAQLSAGSAVAVAIIAALATVLAQWLPALAGH